MISVHVAAASAVMRAGLESVVRAGDGLTLLSSGSTDHLEQHLDDLTADVLLLTLPALTDDWISALAAAALPAVVLASAQNVYGALRAGIRAVLPPNASAGEITAAVTAAYAGLIAVSPAALDSLHSRAASSSEPLEEPLTPRELDVLALLAEGHSNKLIGQSLGISDHTVKFHVAAIMTKLQAGSRTDAVMQGIRRGLIMA